ncbi:formate dehydrogenase (NAD+) [Phytophthora pseudosyringae]|uniref:Formate dehydrogenase (NAD+) n=1 Tax=Phytophthora pseudosyringae TaxID=221518 RepID=A0A8T1V954_9STRA|nr:formate dehydrogenase (NAD+) [Phytophthora pseudosyringae]
MNDFLARLDGDTSGQQRGPTRLPGDRRPALSDGSLAPSFPQAQTPFQPLSAMANSTRLHVSTAAFNASASSSPLSSCSSTAAESADPVQPWVALMERRGVTDDSIPRQDYESRTATMTPKAMSLEQYNRLSRGEAANYTTKKRGVEDEPRSYSTSGEEGKSYSVTAVEKPKRKRKYRKATHTIRKEEKERLLKEVEALKAQIAGLRDQTKVPFDENEEIMERTREVGKALRQGVQQRQQVFIQLSSIMSEYTLCTIQSGSPLQDFIHLKSDEQSRHDTLAAIKVRKMEKAERFMKMRRPNLDPCNTMGEERRYEAENGDFCSTRFTVTQFENAQSVKQVFDLLLFYFCNIEISISEKIGHITIREDDGGDDKGIVQNRLVSITHKDVKMESNTVMFSQYYDRSTDKSSGPGDSSYGVIVADFVDEDDRHPYVPSQRVRRDVNAVLEIREFVPQRAKSVAGGRQSVVVLSRWVQNRMHYPKFPVCTDGWYELRDNMDLWGRALHRTVAENLRGRP